MGGLVINEKDQSTSKIGIDIIKGLSKKLATLKILDKHHMDYLLEYAGHKKIVDFGNKKHEDLTITTDKSYAEALKKIQKDNPGAKITPGVIYQAEGQKTRNITFHIEKK